MLRSRLVWFTVGFTVTGAAITQFVWRDLLAQRYAISADMKQKFDNLNARVSNLDSGSTPGKMSHVVIVRIEFGNFKWEFVANTMMLKGNCYTAKRKLFAWKMFHDYLGTVLLLIVDLSGFWRNLGAESLHIEALSLSNLAA
ncbi:hypothetical protein ACFE04_030356 [Oxalis oulophora]